MLTGSPEVLVVPDATKDPRFSRNPLVIGPPYIRFYAGAALIVGGVRIGSLCILDTVPRDDFDIKCKMNLLDLGEAVSAVIREKREQTIRADNERTKLVMDTMHNIRTPLMSLGIASSILATDRQRISDILLESSAPDRSELAESFFETLGDILTSIGDLKISVESNLSLSSIILENNPLAHDGRVQPVRCDILQRVLSVQSTLKELHNISHLNWSIDTTVFSQGKHLSHPEAITYVLLSTLSKAIILWENISIEIYFLQEDEDEGLGREKDRSDIISPLKYHDKYCVSGYVKILIKVSIPIRDRVEYRHTSRRLSKLSQEDSRKFDGWENCGVGKLLSELLIEQKAVHRVIKDVGGSHRGSLDNKSSNMIRQLQLEYATNPVPDNELELIENKDSSVRSRKLQNTEKSTEEFEYSIPCIIIPRTNTKKDSSSVKSTQIPRLQDLPTVWKKSNNRINSYSDSKQRLTERDSEQMQSRVSSSYNSGSDDSDFHTTSDMSQQPSRGPLRNGYVPIYMCAICLHICCNY